VMPRSSCRIYGVCYDVGFCSRVVCEKKCSMVPKTAGTEIDNVTAQKIFFFKFAFLNGFVWLCISLLQVRCQ
jgi:hypothetical protein